ncbi:succinate dehydrogenase assembly factor 2 [Candidatus Pelagibacter bacterium nBUS_49]|uniref:succinate dehydrogenase assembly factor 2 n=1 Tax=Candidatus Pelagibacter bacterium nBUS_49 TaxID=3374196 RepID=UPI003EBC29F4
MTLNIDLLKKKIIYRSSYRGTKEMDKLLGSFTKKYIEILSLKDLIDLEKMLDIDDTNLYNYYNGLDCDIEFKENYINTLFKNFIYDIEKN